MKQTNDLYPHLTIAIPHPIYNFDNIKQKYSKLDHASKDGAALAGLYEQMVKNGTERFLVSPVSAACIDPMYETCLNFTPLIDELRGAILLATEDRTPLAMEPILLLGESGVGKTHFAMMFGKLLGTGFSFIPMSQMTADWILDGTSSTLNGARKGKIAETLIEGIYANPVVVIDDIDEVNGKSECDPMGTIYKLLGSDTSKVFVDKYVDVAMDASNILFIATANDESCIPKQVLNQMKVVDVKKPTLEHMRAISLVVYTEILTEHHWNFVSELSDDVLDTITMSPLQTMKFKLMYAFRMAKLAGRDHLIPGDLACASHSRQRMGFLD